MAPNPFEHPVVICDNGSGYVKCGFHGDILPRHVFPSFVGRLSLQHHRGVADKGLKEVMVGDEAEPHMAYLSLSYPIENGII
ncbi:actin family protein, partial [Kipferlia bialata]|eukprot:g13383.t1